MHLNETGPHGFGLGAPATFTVCRIEEPIALGQRVEAHRVEAWIDNKWTPLAQGTTIGHKRIHRFPAVTARRVRLTIDQARGCPAIRAFGLHQTP